MQQSVCLLLICLALSLCEVDGGLLQFIGERLSFLRRGSGIDKRFKQTTDSLYSNPDGAARIIEELQSENDVLRTQNMILKKNAGYQKDHASRLRKEKETLRRLVESIRHDTTEELTNKFIADKASLIKEMRADFEKETSKVNLFRSYND
tara:strand:- start:381 stop:830 length:450 start_codon:yes stop_codon:yes gene_type:complete